MWAGHFPLSNHAHPVAQGSPFVLLKMWVNMDSPDSINLHPMPEKSETVLTLFSPVVPETS